MSQLEHSILIAAVLISLPLASVSAEVALPPERLGEWREQVREYVESMATVEAEILGRSDARKDGGDVHVDLLDLEARLGAMDAKSRHLFMREFIALVNRHYGDEEDGLKFTGGTPAGGSGFRPGFGDYDMETPAENIDAIIAALEQVLPPGVEVDRTHGDYIAIDALRVTIFRRAPAKDVSELGGDEATLLAAAKDKEVYLHLRLDRPDKSATGDEAAYTAAVSALEIQGHIKKGIGGVTCDPERLLHDPELLQTTAKSASKSLTTAGHGEGTLEGDPASPAMAQAAATAGFSRTAGQLGLMLRGLRELYYLDPASVGVDGSNVAAFQRAIREFLRLADEEAEARVAGAETVLDRLRRTGGDPDLERRLELALTLYRLQRRVNQEKLTPRAVELTTLRELLAYFQLPEDTVVDAEQRGVPVHLDLEEDPPRALISERRIVARWRAAQDRPERPSWGASRKEGRSTEIVLTLDEMKSDQEARAVFSALTTGGREERGDPAAEAREILEELRRRCERDSGERSYESPSAPGGAFAPAVSQGRQSVTESMEGTRDSYSTVTVGESARLWIQQTIESRVHAQTSPLPHQEFQKGGRTMYRYRWRNNVQILNEHVVSKDRRQGILAHGRFVVQVELQDYPSHGVKVDSEGNKHVVLVEGSPPVWPGVEARFRQLAGKRASLPLGVGLALGSRDRAYVGVAADGASTLSLEVTVRGDAAGLAKVRSVSWNLVTKAADGAKGELEYDPGKGVQSGSTLVHTARFRAPEEMLEEHTEVVQATVHLEDGRTLATQPLELRVTAPPILLLHGIWADHHSMSPLAAVLRERAASPMIDHFEYGNDSAGTLLPIARRCRKLIDTKCELMRQRFRIKCGRVNLVAHSMGGLVARLVVFGRAGDSTLPGDLDRVFKLVTIATPHRGSHVADWYASWNPDALRGDTKPSRSDYEQLMTAARLAGGLRNDALTYGAAVHGLRATDNPFLEALEREQRARGQAHLRVYCVAGERPLISETKAKAAAATLTSAVLLAKRPDPATELRRMIDECFANLSLPDTDGVVSVGSALPGGLFDRLEGKLVVREDHFSVAANPQVMAAVHAWLTTPSSWKGAGTTVRSLSPTRLHVTDARGAELANAIHVAYRDALGEHELVWAPGCPEVRVELEVLEPGRAGLQIAQAAEAKVTTATCRDLEVGPGDRLVVAVDGARRVAEHRRPGQPPTRLSLEAERLEFAGGAAVMRPTDLALEEPPELAAPEAKISRMPPDPSANDPIVVFASVTPPAGERATWRWVLDGKHLADRDGEAAIELGTLRAGDHELRLEMQASGGGTHTEVERFTVSER